MNKPSHQCAGKQGLCHDHGEPLRAEGGMSALPMEAQSPYAAFSDFTHEELVTAVRNWIHRCNKAERDRTNLLAALNSIAKMQAVSKGMQKAVTVALAAIADAQEAA
jgi:hypothetical protein